MGFLQRTLGAGWPWQQRADVALRDVAPLEGANMSLWNSEIPNWWAQNITAQQFYGTPALSDQVWVANRCQKLNAQAIAAMKLEWHGPPGGGADVGVEPGSVVVPERDR